MIAPGLDDPTALERLAAVSPGGASRWRSLDPAREHARALHEVGLRVLDDAADPGAARAWAEGLVAIAHAMAQAFPQNIFGDLEFLAASLWRGARGAPEGVVPYLRAQARRIAALQGLFGEGTAIRFRYVHDFVYGFDWAKWVARDPKARAGVGPFAPPFLAFMHQRGHELLQLIAQGRDRKYPPLPDGRPRNPFGFSREPPDEIALHRSLAADGLIPVAGWRTDAEPRWDRPYADLRRQRAFELGLGQPEPPAPDER